jgi:hypothetical protein
LRIFMMDSFLRTDFKARDTNRITRLTALQVIWGIRNSTEPLHDRANIKEKPFSPLTDSRFRAHSPQRAISRHNYPHDH